MIRLRAWIRATLRARRVDREMREEMEAHLERATERFVARGLGPAEARRAALREFGNVDYLQEQARDARDGRWVESVWADLRYALRTFRRTPVVTGAIVAVLALGIGANAGIVAFVHSLLTMPAPGIPRDDALVRIRAFEERTVRPGGPDSPPQRFVSTERMPFAEVQEYRAEGNLFTSVAAWIPEGRVSVQLGDGELPLRVGIEYVTGNYFTMLGLQPAVGRGIWSAPQAELGVPVLETVISHTLWVRHFGRSEAVVGRRLRVAGTPVTVIGVAPPRFDGVDPLDRESTMWLPLSARRVLNPEAAPLADHQSRVFRAAARLADGVTPERATVAVDGISRRIAAASAASSDGEIYSEVVPLLADNLQPGSVRADLMEAGLAGLVTLLVLLITCVNVAALLAAAAIARRREIAVQLSLGAPRPRIVRQLLTESVLRAVVGGVLGAALLWVLLGAFSARVPGMELVVEEGVLLFTFGAALVVGIAVGLAPALHATRLAVSDVLKESSASLSRSRFRLRRALVVAQVALTQPLLAGLAALLVTSGSYWRSLGSDTLNDRIVALTLASGPGDSSPEGREEVMRRVQERIGTLPGVVGVAPTTFGYYGLLRVRIHPQDVSAEGRRNEFTMRVAHALAGYFELVNLEVVRGRDFDPDERDASAPLDRIIVDTDVATALWADADPVGRRLITSPRYGEESRELVVVGVVDAREAANGPSSRDLPVYVPSMSGVPNSLLVRTAAPARELIPRITAAARNEAPELTVANAQTLAEIARQERSVLLQATGGAAAGGALALLLSALALYGLVSAEVGQRVREIGIRAALGADRARLVGVFLAQGIRLGALGLALGLPVGLGVLYAMAGEVRLTPGDQITAVAWVAAAVLFITTFATWLPARRAASMDPQVVLRAE